MTKLRVLAFVLLVFLATGTLFAQEDGETEPAEIEWECPEGFEGQSLNVYNWTSYIGETTITDFEELCGVDVTYDNFDTNEALIARMRQGNPGYDVAFPNDYAVSIMARESLIQPIESENITNLDNIAEVWRELPFDPDNTYTVPYLWGTFGVLYDIDKVGEEITSWQQVYDHEGPVAWINDARSHIAVALQILGYDPNSTDPNEIAEARDYLIENGDNVIAIPDTIISQFVNGEYDIVVTYSGDSYQAIAECECDNFRYALPLEGSVVDISNMVLLADAPNPELAQVFMDYMLDPAVNAMIVNDTAYATPNQAAIDSGMIEPELLTNPAITPDEEALENLFFLEDVGEAELLYLDAWDEIVIAISFS